MDLVLASPFPLNILVFMFAVFVLLSGDGKKRDPGNEIALDISGWQGWSSG